MLEVLKGFKTGFRGMVRGVDKRKRRDDRERADECLGNLGAFIEYKEKNRI